MSKVSWPVILASASPRRQDLLKLLIPEFKVMPAHVDEESLTVADPFQTAQRLSREKAMHISGQNPGHLVIGGDTVVAFEQDGEWIQLAKPTDKADAIRILGILSGRTHTVITGVCLVWPGGLSSFTDSSEVTFKEMSREDIEAYAATGEPMDKAGAYGLQGGARPFIASVRGSINNVIGLPTERLEEALRSIK